MSNPRYLRLVRWLRLLFSLTLLLGYGEGVRVWLAKANLPVLAKTALRLAALDDEFDPQYCGHTEVVDRAVQTLRDDYGVATISYTVGSTTTVAVVDAAALLALGQAVGPLDCRIDSHRITITQWEAVYDAWVGAARYYWLRDYVRGHVAPVVDTRYLSISFCSDRPGYEYNETVGRCTPKDDVGTSWNGGDRLRLGLTYAYPVGSSFGLALWTIPVQTVMTVTADCFLLGCFSGITFVLTPTVPADYTLEVMSTENGRVVVHCGPGDPGFIGRQWCLDRGVMVAFNIPPEDLTYTLRWQNRTVTGTARPIYAVSRPNGPRCSPTCWNADVEIDISK